MSADGRGLPASAVEIVASVAQHRALSTQQIREIHLPQVGKRWSQRVMARIERAGLLAHAQAVSAPQRLWFATDAGLRAAKQAGVIEGTPRLFSAGEISGPLQAHTVAVNDAAICFLRAARSRGDEFGPLSWRQEVAHPLGIGGRGRSRRTLFADAVLTYLRLTDDKVLIEQRFLELDRATMSVDSLAAELRRYARLCRAMDGARPIWRNRYPAFPPVLCVLAAASRAVLERRRDAVLALLEIDPEFGETREVSISICLADDLKELGPFAPIFHRANGPTDPVNWLGEPE